MANPTTIILDEMSDAKESKKLMRAAFGRTVKPMSHKEFQLNSLSRSIQAYVETKRALKVRR